MATRKGSGSSRATKKTEVPGQALGYALQYTRLTQMLLLAPEGIRDEASQLLGVNWVSDYLVASTNVKEREEAAMRLVYLNVRASLMTGLFRSHRIEKRNSPDRLPSYMGLISSGGDQVQAYLRALIPDIERQLPMALAYHLLEFHQLEYWFGYLKARADHVR